jgi:hypothetical protein
LATLAIAARSGPVAVINIHESRCDALIVEKGKVIHVSLSEFSYSQAQELQGSLSRLLVASGVRMQDIRGPRMVSTNPDDTGFEEILSMLWMRVIKPILNTLAFSVSYLSSL